jgi:PIN domain nuclease of toxin-antitoxin system
LRPRFLLDTNVFVRWLYEPRKLSREQARIITNAEENAEPLAVSAITLFELVGVLESGRVKAKIQDILGQLRASSRFQILPMTIDITSEMASLGPSLRDPADRAIVATARVHRLTLLTSDQRIADSRLVPVID